MGMFCIARCTLPTFLHKIGKKPFRNTVSAARSTLPKCLILFCRRDLLKCENIEHEKAGIRAEEDTNSKSLPFHVVVWLSLHIMEAGLLQWGSFEQGSFAEEIQSSLAEEDTNSKSLPFQVVIWLSLHITETGLFQ